MYSVPTAKTVCIGVMLLAQSVITLMQFGFMGMRKMERSTPLAQRDSIHLWGSCSRSAAVDGDRASAETSP